MLRERLTVAAVGLPLLAALLAAPEPVFAGALEALLALAAFEMVRSARSAEGKLTLPVSAAVATALVVALIRSGVGTAEVSAYYYDCGPLSCSLEGTVLWSLLAATAVALALVLSGRIPRSGQSAGWWLAAVLYTAVLGVHLVLLRGSGDGQRWLVVLVVTVFATDTAAYASGRLLGRHLLWPRLSPAKTWEGAAGGLLAGAVAALVVVPLAGLSPSATALPAAAAGAPLAAIAGDLLESGLKRRAGVKDFSEFLPGHGGLLDRLDSLLVAGPWLYWVVRWLT